MAIIPGVNLGINGALSPAVGPALSYGTTAISAMDKYITDDATREKLGLKPRGAKDGVRPYADVPYSASRGILAPKDYTQKDEILYFQFNPEQISDSKSVEWSAKSYIGFNSVDYHWVKGGERDISFKLTFDATASSNTPLFGLNTEYGNPGYDTLDLVFPRGVMPSIDKIKAFQEPILTKTDITDAFGRSIPVPEYTNGSVISSPRFLPPPVVIFVFGDIFMEGIISNAAITYTLFDTNLFPIRADVDISFKMLQMQQVGRIDFPQQPDRDFTPKTYERPDKQPNIAPFVPNVFSTFV